MNLRTEKEIREKIEELKKRQIEKKANGLGFLEPTGDYAAFIKALKWVLRDSEG